MSAKRRALGRGLDALLGGGAAAVTAEREPRALPLERLRPNRLQSRAAFAGAELDELAASIRSQGVVQPLVVTPRGDGRYTIVAGERRWRAARRAGLAEVPVVVRRIDDDRELLETALVENLQRSDLNPIEEAEAYRRLQQEFGLRQEDIARRVGKSRAAVSNCARLLGLPVEVQKLVRGGELTAGQVRPLVALADADAQLSWARRAVAEGLSARHLEQAVAAPGARPARRGRKKAVDADTAAAAEKLTRRLQTKVEIHRARRGGTVRISFHSEDELMRIYDLLLAAKGGS